MQMKIEIDNEEECIMIIKTKLAYTHQYREYFTSAQNCMGRDKVPIYTDYFGPTGIQRDSRMVFGKT